MWDKLRKAGGGDPVNDNAEQDIDKVVRHFLDAVSFGSGSAF